MTARTGVDFYADPLVYHVLHLQGTRSEVAVFERIARRHAVHAPGIPLNWLEPASGTGRYLHELARRGHRGTGIDLSPGMNRFACDEAHTLNVGAQVRFLTAKMERFSVQKAAFQVALNPINSIRHLTSDAAMLAHLGCVRKALAPTGCYIVGIELSEPSIAQPTEDVWQGRRPGLRVHQFVSYLPPEGRSRLEKVVSHLTVTRGSRKERIEQHYDTLYHLRTYTRAQWLKLLARAGWSIECCYGPTGRPKPLAPIGYTLQVLRPVD